MKTAEQKKEAIKRMKAWGLHENVIKEFEENDTLNLSENGGFLYWLDEAQKEIVSEFEEKYNAVVYHIIHSFTQFGELLSMLYVSAESEEWELDEDDIKHGTPIAYVENLTEKEFSEFGYIGVKPSIGGLVRIS